MITKKPYITSASFLMTEDCNLRCKYCFEKHRQDKIMSKEVIKKGLDFLCQNSLAEGSKRFHAMIFGGEPLLCPDELEYLLEYGYSLADKYNARFSAGIVTNATILTPRVQEILRKYIPKGLGVQLSVDGVKESHDMYRVTRTGKGSFDIIERNIPKWKELFKNHMNQINVHGCLNKQTLKYLYDSYIFFREEWDIPAIWFMPIHSEEWDESDVALYESELNKIADYILERAKREGTLNEVKYYAPIDRCLRPDSRPSAPCGAGKSFVTISAEGFISPCHHLYFNDPEGHTIIGNLDDGIDEMRRKLYVEYDNSDLTCDPNCQAYHCYRCLADNFCENGSPFSQIKGHRCQMSLVERKVQLRVKQEVEKMGLLNKQNNRMYQQGNNPDNPDCLCDSRGTVGTSIQPGNNPSNPACLCDARGNASECHSEKVCNNDSNEGLEVIASALSVILQKLESIEETQNFMLKKIL